MIPMRLAEIAEVVGGTVAGDPATAVTAQAFLDSRQAVSGGLFVAIAGEHVDGHDYAERAAQGGAAAVLASRPTPAPTVVVDDAAAALATLARHVRNRLDRVTVLALTGSQGKTGTKDYLAAILGCAGRTVATAGNYNNELGVPLTVLRADAETEYLVVEMGARQVRNIAELCRIAPPDVAAVLNVGTAHVGEFGSQDAIALAKGEIVEALTPAGVAVLNADDPRVIAMASRTSARALTFGLAGDVSWRALECDDLGRPSFELGHAGGWEPVCLAQLGKHQVPNAAAAAAMALATGLELSAIAEALTASRPASRWRMELRVRADGTAVINDAYNANPASMVAALDALAGIGARGRRRTVAVLGEMRELGEDSPREHAGVGRYAAERGIDVVLAVGPEAAGIAEGASSVAGWDGIGVVAAGCVEAIEWLRHNGTAGDVVLVKASRAAALERVADGLLETDGGEPTR